MNSRKLLPSNRDPRPSKISKWCVSLILIIIIIVEDIKLYVVR